MKLACADFTFPLLTHDAALDLITSIEIGAVDIGLHSGRTHFQPRDFLGRIPAAARELSGKVRDRGLEFADIYLISGYDFRERCENHPEPAVREESRDLFLRTLEFVVRCNAPHMTTLPGSPGRMNRRAILCAGPRRNWPGAPDMPDRPA